MVDVTSADKVGGSITQARDIGLGLPVGQTVAKIEKILEKS